VGEFAWLRGERMELKKKDWERYYMVKHGMRWYDMV